MSVCLSVGRSVRSSGCISQEPHVPVSSHFLCMLPVAVARSSSGGVAIFIAAVLWMTSCDIFPAACAHSDSPGTAPIRGGV